AAAPSQRPRRSTSVRASASQSAPGPAPTHQASLRARSVVCPRASPPIPAATPTATCAAAWASGSAPNRLPQKQAATAPAASGDRSPSPIGARAPRLVFGEWIEVLVGEHLKL